MFNFPGTFLLLAVAFFIGKSVYNDYPTITDEEHELLQGDIVDRYNKLCHSPMMAMGQMPLHIKNFCLACVPAFKRYPTRRDAWECINAWGYGEKKKD